MQVEQYTLKQENYIDHKQSETDEESLTYKAPYSNNSIEAPDNDPTIIDKGHLVFTPGSSATDSLGIQGLMKSFSGKKTFSDSLEEDLDSTVSVYKTWPICDR